MATMQRRLVHKQFNSPINLYSQRNIQETLDRELKQLSNGAIGIDFDDPSTTKPPSLAKSAVLQALEEEERQQSRGKGLKRVAWPPSAEGGDEYEQVQQQQPQQQQPQQQQYYQQPQQQQAPAFQQYQQPAQQQQQPRERIIPIQRTTSHVSPHRTPKSPLGGGHQQPKYPQQHQPAGRVGSSTVSFSSGRPVLPQQAHPQQQQQHYQPAPRPVSAPYHQQVQQQNRYSSPSTASLGSPRSPQIVAGGGHSPRGWAHVQSPVPVYRPAPQHHQQQQQQYVPAPFQTDLNPSAYHRQASAGYGPRKVHY
uniref:(northern house mosquito) hypothetical protein n=1 Tax=Culex pipiens TaxID=7175 RepID=A0A8D8K1I2_CULPI